MTLSLAVRAFALVTLANLLLHLPASSGKNPRLARHLMDEASGDDGWFSNGRATCADGSVDLNRMDACYDTTTTITIQILDTCPCKGNEKWCCGDANLQHFDLSAGAFSRLAPQGKGIIGLAWKPVPCEAINGTASLQDWQALQQATVDGASRDIFHGGVIGVGWRKTIYGDDKAAMYSYESSLESLPEGAVARWGGFDFNADARDTTVFNGASAVEFWAKSPNGIPDGFVFRASDISQGACKEYRLEEGATLDTANGWTRFSFPISDFECGQGMLNRIQWENKSESKQSICVKDVRIIAEEASAVAAAGRR
ncbi:hypothetical protein CHLNCDRAFT_142704 [Chlorella variabilis]|uniref:Expansin-like EG45 domain-containing protein n=1 Tax=Chlorella variabilis TaxID=554065 RepID=E1Z8I7_CHLVA|nr:hypothetical protein CHLNCDRAFT_142704 [Chlorella variabilis]EFN57617.1 hypothetical protein CHLNCDRAFT_142704 [Chlorella variabilis]|eukprot:XP_005849719.1 hypothetical protein CHLNCDRAFT_142704 [Chlorella variabilis]